MVHLIQRYNARRIGRGENGLTHVGRIASRGFKAVEYVTGQYGLRIVKTRRRGLNTSFFVGMADKFNGVSDGSVGRDDGVLRRRVRSGPPIMSENTSSTTDSRSGNIRRFLESAGLSRTPDVLEGLNSFLERRSYSRTLLGKKTGIQVFRPSKSQVQDSSAIKNFSIYKGPSKNLSRCARLLDSRKCSRIYEADTLKEIFWLQLIHSKRGFDI